MTVRVVLGALIWQQAACARLVDVQEAADEGAFNKPFGALAPVIRLENRGVGPGGDVSRFARGDRPVVDASAAVDATLGLRGGAAPEGPGPLRPAWRQGRGGLFQRRKDAGMRTLSNRQLRRVINGLADKHVREFGCMWPDETLYNLIKNLPEETLRKLAKGFVRRFPGGVVYAYALNLPIWGLRGVALNLPWGVLRAIPRHVPMPAIRDMIHTMPDDLFRATINGLPDDALQHLAKHRKRWAPPKGFRLGKGKGKPSE